MFVEEKAAGEKEPVKVGTLKLSEAIRSATTLYPQGTGWSANNPCTLCGVALSLGWDGKGHAEDLLRKRFPVLNRSVVPPIEAATACDLFITIEALNGWGGVRWDREQIAGWLESQGL